MADQEVVENLETTSQNDTQNVAPKTEQVSERTFTQSQVSKIVGKEVHEAKEKARRDVLKEFENRPQPSQSMGGIPQYSQEDLKSLIAEETNKRLQEITQSHEEKFRQEQGMQIANTFTEKLALGKEKYSDFDSVVGEVDFRTIPEIVLLTVDLDNVSDVVYDLAKNPHKISSILTMYERNKGLARKQMKDIADSIKMNSQAQNSPGVPPPLKPISPSNVSADNGVMSVKDYQRQSWLRG